MRCFRCQEMAKYVIQPFCADCGIKFADLVLEIKPSSNLNAGASAWVGWRVRNTGPLEGLSVHCEVFSPDLELGGEPAGHDRLNANTTGRERHIQLTPPNVGSYRVDFFVHVNDVWIARCQVILSTADPASKHPPSVIVNARNTSEQAVSVGNDTITLRFEGNDAKPLCQGEYSAVTLEIVLPHETPTMQKLRLTLSSGRKVILVGVQNRQVTIGRSRKTDIMLRGSNDDQSLQISGHHANIRFDRVAQWEQLPAAWGTTVDGSPMIEGQVLDLCDGQEITVAHAVTIRPTSFTERLPDDVRQAYMRHCQRHNQKHRPAEGRVSSILLSSTSEAGLITEYILIQEAIRLGSDPGCALPISGNHVRPFHARIAFLAGQFWIEPCQPEAAVTASGKRVPYGYRVPLRGDSTFRLGETSINVEEG